MSEDQVKANRMAALEKARANLAAKRAAEKAAVAEQAIPVEPSVSADASLAESPPRVDDRQQYLDEIARIRKTRKPFGAFTQKLALPVRPGYHRHWFNDVPGRIEEAQASGWTHVEDGEGKPIRRVVSARGPAGNGLYAFAMEIPSVFWEEDRELKRQAARRPIEAIKASPFKAQPGQAKSSDKEKFYSPHEEVVTITKK